MANIAFLKFPVTTDILNQWNSGINTDFFDTGDNTLQLFLHPNDYQPLEEDLGTRGVTRGLSTYIVQTPVRKIGFELTIRDSREAIAKTLEALRSANDAGLVTVHDYVRVDAGDEGVGYTVRSLIMEPPLRQGGSLWYGTATGDRLFTGGFTVRFVEP